MVATGEEQIVLETSVGRLEVVYGWHNLVSVRGEKGARADGLVRRRGDLARLLEQAGLGSAEAQAVTPGVWKRRPRGRHAGVPDPGDSFGTGWWALIVFVGAGIAITLWALIWLS